MRGVPPLPSDEDIHVLPVLWQGGASTASSTDAVLEAMAALAAHSSQCALALVQWTDNGKPPCGRQGSHGLSTGLLDGADAMCVALCVTLCAELLGTARDPVVVHDAQQHPGLRQHPWVQGEQGLRFVAVVPLPAPEVAQGAAEDELQEWGQTTAMGAFTGFVAVLDTVPRTLDAAQRRSLELLAQQVQAHGQQQRQQQRQTEQWEQKHHRAQAEITAHNDALHMTGQLARIGAWTLALPGQQINLSPEAVHLLGQHQRRLSMAQLLQLYAAPLRTHLERALNDCLRHGTPFDIEGEMLLPGPRKSWVRTAGRSLRNAQAHTVQVQGAFQDLSIQHQAQEARHALNERFQHVSQATTDCIWDWNLHTNVLWWNEGLHKLFGLPTSLSPDNGEAWSEHLHPEDREATLQSLQDAIHGPALQWSAQYRFRHLNGHYTWVKDSGVLIRDADGKAVRMVGSMSDISASQKAAEDAESDAQNHAELLQVQQRISSLDMPLPEVMDLVVSTVLRQTHASGALIEFLQAGELVAHASLGEHVRPAGHRLSLDESQLWSTLRLGQTVVINNVEDEHWDLSGHPYRRSVHSVMAVPLRTGDAVVGSLFVSSNQHNAFSQRDVARLEILTESLGAMVHLRQVAGQLHASEQQYRTMFDAHPHPMWVYDKQSLRLQAVNRAMVAHYGYSESELQGMCMTTLWPASQRAALRLQLQTPVEQPRNDASLTQHVRKDGTVMDMEILAGNISFNGRPARQVLTTDVTERLRTERELLRMSRAQRLLSACNETLVRATSEPALLQAICQIAVDIGGYRMGWVGFARDDAAQSIEPVAYAGYNEGYTQNLKLSWSQDSVYGLGPAGMAIRTGNPVIIKNIRTEGNFVDWIDRMLAHGFHGVVCLPLRDRHRTFGLMYLYAPEVLDISKEEIDLLQELSNDLAFGITSLRAHQAQQRMQASVLKVAAAVSASTGTEFFEQLVRNMAEALNAQCGCIVRLQTSGKDQPTHVTTLASVLDGKILPIEEYSLKETPSLHLLTQRNYVVTDAVQLQYPQAPILRKLGARGYAGQQLCNADGQVVGFIFVLFRQPLVDTDFITSTLQIFAARTSTEIERQVADAHIRHQASLLDKAQDAIIVRDLQHRIIYWNKSAERLYGWTQAETLGQSSEGLLYPDPMPFRAAIESVKAHGEWAGELTQQNRSGELIEVEGRWTLVRDDAGQPQSILAINTDIRERKQHEREIQRLAFYDALTGLPNRMLLLDRIHHALATAQRRQQGGALLFIDLDNFKTLNDTLGHDKGDLLLQQVAQRLSHCVRAVDTVARLGGDEFVVMLEELGPHAHELALHARVVGEKILSTLALPYALAGYEYRSTPSIGIAPFTGEHNGVGELLKQADLAMYQAKSAGRNTLRFFDPEMQAVVTARAALETDLRAALTRGEFLLHFQPQVHALGQCTGVEALVRWAHPQRGMVMPVHFIAVAEETGLILALGRWVLQAACTQLASWQSDAALQHLTMAINVSSRQFRHAGFVEDVAHMLASTGAPPDQLKLELTESLLVEDMEATIATMEALRTLGVRFSLDDFGTGYSSLAYLKRMPLDQLKIDRSFVRDLLTDPNDAAIVDTIIGLSRNLGLEVMAEGVETPEQREMLIDAGCMHHQGYLFSRPLSADLLDSYLRGLPR